MAHNCPDCDQQCYCNGDIDDCCFNLEEDQLRCIHYLSNGCDAYENDDDYEGVSRETFR